MANTCWLLLLSLVLSHPTGASSVEDDEACLIQLKHDLHKTTTKDDSCACMGWSSAYKAGAKCGQGGEFHPLGDGLMAIPNFDAPKHRVNVTKEFCNMYFERLNDDNMCQREAWDSQLNDDYTPARKATWCYVSSNCTETNTGNTTGLEAAPQFGYPNVPALKWKHCGAADRKFGDMKFEELAAYALESKLELGFMAQFAYNTIEEGKLADVQEFWGLKKGDGAASTMPEELRSKLHSLKDSGATMFIGSSNSKPPYAVLEGQKLYWINSSDANEERKKNGEDLWEHKETMNAWGCVAGCASGRHWSPLSAIW
jgi:hypothetical protein